MESITLPESYLRENLPETHFLILEMLRPDGGSRQVMSQKDIVRSTGKSKSVVSEGLSVLREHGIVEAVENDGRRNMYRLASFDVYR